MDSSVRLASLADVPALIDMLFEMHKETGIGGFDPERVRLVVESGIHRSGGVVGVIRGDDRTVEASIGLFMGSSWYSSDPHLFDLWSYVLEPYRRSTHAKSLIQFAKQAATELALPLIMVVVSNEHTARKERLFERQLPKSGSLFTFTPPPVVSTLIAAA